jgi:hypothetical protein
MLRRQRTILRLLSAANAPLSATQFQKLVFLLREETFVRHDGAFYEFLPYKFGAYSFSAQREIEALIAYGYIQTKVSALSITNLGKRESSQVDKDTSRAVVAIISKYGKIPLKTLLKDVYGRYPWYASKSELKDLVPSDVPKPKIAPIAIYTMGYEERSVDGFLNRLLQVGIRRIIDIRANPVSRKYGFARSSMSGIAGKLGLLYRHCPELGISSAKRRDVETPSEFRQLFKYYEHQILPTQLSAVSELADLVKGLPSVLVCMEKEAVDCHRSRLAACLAGLTNLEIVHL